MCFCMCRKRILACVPCRAEAGRCHCCSAVGFGTCLGCGIHCVSAQAWANQQSCEAGLHCSGVLLSAARQTHATLRLRRQVSTHVLSCLGLAADKADSQDVCGRSTPSHLLVQSRCGCCLVECLCVCMPPPCCISDLQSAACPRL